MKELSYILLLAGVGLWLTSCDSKNDNDNESPNHDAELIIRNISVEDGSTIRPIEAVTADYNYQIDIKNGKNALVNGGTTTVYVNPSNKMQLIIPMECEWNRNYTVTVPEGMICIKDNPDVTNKGFEVSFNTNIGINKSTVSTTLTNPEATKEAKELYALFFENYGIYMFSGAMGGVNWETGYTDFISQNNGSNGYPKIVGFDYIHLPYSPSNWIDYGDISPVQNIWDSGSIPAITWHWLTPDSQSGELKYDSDFSPIAALTTGSRENEIIESDIAKLAAYMKLLMDADIPVLFRPFHEAAGDYGYGAWFWWGNDGTEATKQLWSYLRSKLETKYGLNNLIWVWTMQTSEYGKPADVSLIRDAYPGDNLVDMVGTDLYPEYAMTDQTEQFALVNSAVNGKKMVALCEIGNLIDPTLAAANNALWIYFMNWYDYASEGVFGFNMWNTQKVTMDGKSFSNPWEAVSSSPYVINR